MSDVITFIDDAERRFWEEAFNASVAVKTADLPEKCADYAVRHRRKRLGPTPPGAPPTVPEEVRTVLEVDLTAVADRIQFDADFAATMSGRTYRPDKDTHLTSLRAHIDAIRAARRVLGMDAEKQENP